MEYPTKDVPTNLRERARRVIESSLFERFITVLILVNAIAPGMETSPMVGSSLSASL